MNRVCFMASKMFEERVKDEEGCGRGGVCGEGVFRRVIFRGHFRSS